MMLNKFEKEALVIKLLNEGKTIKQIAAEAHISFKDIGKISRKLRGETEESSSPKSLETRALSLFADGKSQIDVVTQLDIPSKKVTTIYKEFLRLNRMHLVVWIYEQIKYDIRVFLKLYFAMKDRDMGVEDFVRAVECIEQIPYPDKDIPQETKSAILHY